MQLDETDQRIIALLQEDARSSYADIGAKVSLSAPAVKRRVDRLRSSGVIRGYTAIIDPGAVGWTTEAFVELFCTGRTSPQQLRAEPFGTSTRSMIVLSRLVDTTASVPLPDRGTT